MAGPLSRGRHDEPLHGRYGWNTVDLTGPVPDDDVRELVDASYDAAVAALPKSRATGRFRGVTGAAGCDSIAPERLERSAARARSPRAPSPCVWSRRVTAR